MKRQISKLFIKQACFTREVASFTILVFNAVRRRFSMIGSQQWRDKLEPLKDSVGRVHAKSKINTKGKAIHFQIRCNLVILS